MGLPVRSPLLVAVVAALLCPAVIRAQERRPITVEYVGVEGVYLSVGSEQGVAAGDTLSVYATASSTDPVSSLVLVSVTRRRSVAEVIGDASGIERGTQLLIDLPAQVDAEADTPDQPASTAPASGPSPARPFARAAATPRITGRLSLDVDARETRTSWSGDLSGETRRRFATPTTRLSLTASGLPGGFTLRTNLRAAYRYTDLDFGLPTTSYRAYELSAEKQFDAIPVSLRLGRFHNPYESYSAYWDGIMLRVGRPRGIGVGVVAGFQPDRYNEGFSTALPKITGFADIRLRGGQVRYDSDMSIHLLRPEAAVSRTFLGWSQRLTIARLTLDQRLRADRSGASGEWAMSQLRLRVGLGLGSAMRLRATYNKARRSGLLDESLFTAPEREESTIGVAMTGRTTSLNVDVGRTSWQGESGLYTSARGRLSLGRAGLSLSGRHWARSDQTSLSLAPGLTIPIGPVDTRTTYRFYETSRANDDALRTHAADLSLTTRFARAYSLTVRGQQQWGENLSGTRFQFGLVRRF